MLITGLICPVTIFAQKNGENNERVLKETYNNAEIALQEGKFEKALLLYKRLLENDAKNPLLNFLVGYCYQNTDFGLELSLEYLKNAVDNPPKTPEDKAPQETNYYLGKAYHATYHFDEAIKVLTELRTKVPKNEIDFLSRIDKLLLYSQNGLMISQTQAVLKIENLIELNSKYSDKNPILDNQTNTIVFSSRRENSLFKAKFEDGQFDDNVFISSKKDETWSDPVTANPPINSPEHESICWISEDGNKIIIQKIDKIGSSLYMATRGQNNTWNTPEKINSPVNIGTSTTFGSLSPDGKKLYFVSDRKGGYGGTDIYVCENMGNNIWGPAKNLGPKINTPFNEESPIMQHQGVLFFCSEGHTSIGGFDVFVSFVNDAGMWQNPVNMGIPVNSVGNDFFFCPHFNGQAAYISSDREGTKGKSDIYEIDYLDSTMNTSSFVAGTIVCPPETDAFKDIEIKITSEKDGKKLQPIKPNKSGVFCISLPNNQSYSAEFSYKGTPFYFAQLKYGKSFSVACADQSIFLNDIVLNTQNPVINNYSNREITRSVSIANNNIISEYKLKFNESNPATNKYISDNSNDINKNDSNIISKFSIKLIHSDSKIPLNNFKGLSDIKEFQEKDGNYIYYFGEYEYEWEAQIKLKMIREEYPEAEVFVLNKNI
jgi:hypothetical protein